MELININDANKYIQENKCRLNLQYRLKYHLMGEYGWINDPNGFIYYKGNYHLFYQHNPYDAVWGPMHWGHAISKDLVKWTYLPIALVPGEDFDKDGCFSGSAIEKDDMLCLLYTGHIYTGPDKSKDYRQVQNLAYSKDGINFIKYSKNPVIGEKQIPEEASKKDFRDPKVFKNGQYYYIMLGSNDGKGHGQVLLYKSTNLKDWDFVNILARGNENTGYNWECPDLFELDGKYILMVSVERENRSSIYFVGEFEIEKGIFKFDIDDYQPIDYGFDFYAPQTTSDEQGRRLIVAWMDTWGEVMPTQERGHNWAGAMTLPREILMVNGKLYFRPIKEIENYRKNHYKLTNLMIDGEKNLNTCGESYELEVEFEADKAEEFGLKIRKGDNEETVLSYKRYESLFIFDRNKSGIGPKGERKINVALKNNKLKLRVFVDVSSVEIFINNGEKVMSGRIYPSKDSVDISLYSKGECKINYLNKWDIVVN
ncbi:glycoside hydrolase family 32 protein [Thermoanaerobacter wiegelii]|uniref:Sucrose-6-phosphate hydrolase n=1 Tax=Thermoanaerobacter wiegelii Rt8.B1 TaxID=697303 RepID=G2MXL3_9THEO|nr:glycoside hydrolase family 32 protein [Thermoanaerobacter wiegelii]AEM79243.1 sucrose-6-phosphate hydrolase [Thermoanaerobacter wiegelii Rt8.B1]